MNEDDFIPMMSDVKTQREWKQVVRVSTSYWADKKGVHMRKDLIFMKKKSFGYNVLAEDCSNIGSEDVITRIVNLDEVEDGLWELFIINELKDWETGNVEEWDYKLFPYVEEEVL